MGAKPLLNHGIAANRPPLLSRVLSCHCCHGDASTPIDPRLAFTMPRKKPRFHSLKKLVGIHPPVAIRA